MAGEPPARGWIDPDFPNPMGPGDATVIIYGYTPSLAVGILGIVLFTLAGILHTWQLFKYRSWYFSTMVVGIVFEIVGYIFRTLSAKVDPYRVSFFVVQYFFIVVAPVFIAAAIYTILSLLITTTAPHHAPLPPRLILALFISADVLATTTQIVGAALIGVAESHRRDPTTPNRVLLAGLAVQAATFAVFIALFVAWVVRARKVLFKSVGMGFYVAFSAAVVLFYLRVCFRVAETAQGLYGPLNTQEVYFARLEFMPVILGVWLLGVWHPGSCVPGRRVVGREGEGVEVRERRRGDVGRWYRWG